MRVEENSDFSDIDQRLERARQKTWTALELIAKQLIPGLTERDAIKIAQSTLLESGSRKFWHPCHVRFGSSTVLSFNDPVSENVLGEDDLFYIDIGPIWEGIEGDAGKTFYLGNDPEKKRCCLDVSEIFSEVREAWSDGVCSGLELYKFAKERTEKRGWILAPSYVQGHRLSEFPHKRHAGSLTLAELDFYPTAKKWVLEIHICQKNFAFGAFYEDILA